MAKVVVHLDELIAEMNASVRERLGEAAKAGVDRSTQIVPVDTGRLRDSLHSEETEHGAKFGSDVEYAGYVEYGTSRMQAQPYLRPAIDAVVEDLRRDG